MQVNHRTAIDLLTDALPNPQRIAARREWDEIHEEITGLRAEVARLQATDAACGEIHQICADAGIEPGHVVDRVRQLRTKLDAHESAWLVGAPHGSPSDCPCWYDKCLCTVENFAATIERAKQAESQLERLGAKKGCIGGCGFEDTWGVFERIVFDLDSELALLPPHDYTQGKPCFDPVDCADWHAGRIRTGVAQLQDHHAQALELLREALTIPNSGKTRTAITAFLAAEPAKWLEMTTESR